MNFTKKMKMNDGSEVAKKSDMDTVDDSSTPTTKREPDADSIKMFVGQIPRTSTETELREMFSEFGEIYSLNILTDKNTGFSKGCCFISFYTRAAALAAQNALHNIKTLPGMPNAIQMKPADPDKKTGPESPEERKLFVGMITKTTTDEELKIMFAPYGVIEECTILRDSQNNHKGCAFVTFSTRSSAQKAINHLHNVLTMEKCSGPLVVKFAFTQKQKEAKRANAFMNALAKNGIGPMGAASYNNAPLIPNQTFPPPHSLQTLTNVGTINNLASATGLSQSAIHNLIMATSNNSNPVLNQLLKAANPVPNNNNTANMSNVQQMQNLQTLSVLFSAAAANQAAASSGGNLNPYGAQNIAAINQMTPPNPGIQPPLGHLTNNNMPPTLPPTSLPSTGPPIIPGLPGPNQTAPPNPLGQINNMGLPQNPLSHLNPFNNTKPFPGSFPNMFNSPPNMNPQQRQNQATRAVAGRNNEGPEGCNLFIYHLPIEFGDHDLYCTFASFGNIISAKVFIDKVTSLSKCFGFVSFDNQASANAAIQAMNGFLIGQKRLKVQLKRNKSDSKPY